MEEARVRVVVGEGESPRRGLLRFVLEGDGYEVVAEATTGADLARVIADHRPDVVVLDDGIGATAPQVVREISPRTRIVLVWPGAVVPIGGDARVEPSQVLRQLGPTVAKVTAGIAGLTIDRPEWIEKVRKDPATLREMLERRGGLPNKRPSVTELQRRGQRLHPAPSTPAGKSSDDDTQPIAPVVPLVGAVAAAEATIELPDTPESGSPVLRLPGDEMPQEADDGGAVVPIAAAVSVADAGATEFNRRLGTIALGGAAVIGAVVFALAVGGPRVPTDIIVAEGPRTTIAPGPAIDSGLEPGQEPDEGPDREPGEQPDTGQPPPGVTPGNEGPTAGPNLPPPDGGTEPPPDGGTEPPPDLPGDTGTEPPPDLPGGGNAPSVDAPGRSSAHNPHQTPPGQTTDPVGNSSGGGLGNGSGHGADGIPGQAGDHGQGAEHGKGLEKLSHRHKQ